MNASQQHGFGPDRHTAAANGNDSATDGSLRGASGFINNLIAKGILTHQSVRDAIQLKHSHTDHTRRPLFQILIEHFQVPADTIYREFAEYYHFPVLDLADIMIDSTAIAFMNKLLNGLPPRVREMAFHQRTIPLKVSELDPQKLVIITPNPTNVRIPEIARSFPFPKYEVCYLPPAQYEELLRQLTADQTVSSEDPIDVETLRDFEDTEDDILNQLDEEIRKGQLTELVDRMLIDAVRLKASDIHIVPKTVRKTEIHFRIDGRLSLWRGLDGVRTDAIAAVVKDISRGVDRFDRDLAQDGYIQKIIDTTVVRYRVSVLPVIGKESRVKLESIVIRVLKDPEANITVETIGFSPRDLEIFRRAIEKPYGIVIVTGPTGSGKSTTLLAALRAVMAPHLNVITVEDPVEYFIEGARQVKLNPKLNFEQALRSILRHDPDVVMVGEIRDKTTADLAIKLANTGHLTFSTLHTNDAPSAIARLYKMGVEPFLIAYAINVVVAQRLIRKLCPRCKVVDTDVMPLTLEKIGFPKDEIAKTTFYRPKGCIHCIGGYRGRTAIHEILYFSRQIRQLIMEAGEVINEEGVRQAAIREGMRSLRECAIELLRSGVTTIEEVAGTTTDD